MSRQLKKLSQLVAILTLALLLPACGDKPRQQVAQQALAIESGDECHLCGMLIMQFSGPKGGIYNKKATKAHKFCSTRDLFSYYLQPENRRQVQRILVHDMAKTPWDAPNDQHFTDATTAWYVKEHRQQGAMGPTLAAFSTQQDAQSFADSYGGSVIRFGQIDFDLLASLGTGQI